MNRTFDAIVIGTGIIGSFTALSLADRGLEIAVVDRGGLAPGTSRSSDGNLLCHDKSPGVMLELSAESLRLWRRFIERYGNHCEFDPKGSMLVARGTEQATALAAFVASQRETGIDCRFIDTDWHTIEPELGPETSAVGYWPGDAQVQPMLACYQIARELRGRGVPYHFYQAVTGIEQDTGGVTVALADGSRLSAGHLCLCTGVWSNEVLRPLGYEIPVYPRKGHICVLERGDVRVNSKVADFAYNAHAESTEIDETAVRTAAVIESTQSGTILCGSSREHSGFDTTPNTVTLQRIMRDCIGIMPALANLRVIRGYAGLRPFSADGIPLIGPIPGAERLIVASGHEGAGHGLAAVTGELVADCVFAGVTHPYAGQLHPDRFPTLEPRS